MASSDQVMGGVSRETMALNEIDGRRCLRLTGDVRLENNGGFIQMALDLAIEGQPLDASSCAGVLLVARGNGESYGVHLGTTAFAAAARSPQPIERTRRQAAGQGA